MVHPQEVQLASTHNFERVAVIFEGAHRQFIVTRKYNPRTRTNRVTIDHDTREPRPAFSSISAAVEDLTKLVNA